MPRLLVRPRSGARMKPPTQTERLLTYLRQNPGISSLEITLALRIVNVTGRISDLRAAGHVIDCREDKTGTARYYLVVVHEHAWKDAPDWVAGPGQKAQECFACRGVRFVKVPVTTGEQQALAL